MILLPLLVCTFLDVSVFAAHKSSIKDEYDILVFGATPGTFSLLSFRNRTL